MLSGIVKGVHLCVNHQSKAENAVTVTVVEKRRLRRKVSSSLPGQSSFQRFHDSDEADIIPRDELKDEAVALSSRIHSSSPNLETDAQHEKDMTRFGLPILHHAQNLPD